MSDYVKKTKNKDWKLVFVVLISVFSILISTASIIYVSNQYSQIQKLRNDIDTYITTEDSNIVVTDEYFEFCENVLNRTENAINEILVVVGIFASVITLLGVLITFKAPKDIEKDIDEIRNLLSETKCLSEEQIYNLKIADADMEKTIYHRIKALNKVIRDYPTRWKAYIHRGCEYDDKKEYDNAINDYKLAKNFGCDEEMYYNNMSISLSKRAKQTNSQIDFQQALEYISKAIELDSEESIYYTNRGGIYSDIGEFEKALSDYDKAISFDPQNYEAYSNKAAVYIELKESTDDEEKWLYYKNKAIECVKKAIELNSEDTSNLKHLDKLLKDDLSSQNHNDISHEEFGNLIFGINEKIGDIACEEKNYIDAISNYTNALVRFNVPFEEIVESNVDTIDRLCDKIYNCKLQMPTIDISDSINRKLEILIVVLVQIAYRNYQEKNVEKAGLFFEYSTILSGFGTSSSNNLAYIIRRGEYSSNRFAITDLLSCRTPEESSSFLRINRALCMISGIGFDINFEDALREIHVCENELDDAISWWSDESVVGEKETNIVLVLLCLMQKLSVDESADLDAMIEKARADGYDIPQNVYNLVHKIIK